MSRESLIIILGAIVLFMPYAGIPESWKRTILMSAGGILMLLGYVLRRAAYRRRIQRSGTERGTDSFVESHIATGEVDHV